MPIYPFECERGHKFEVEQRPNDERPTSCPHVIDHGGKGSPEPRQCKSPVERIWTPVSWWFGVNYDHH